MSMLLMTKAMAARVGNSTRKLVLLKLADNANDSGECWPSYQHIADHCECSKSTVRAHIEVLIESGLLKKENRLGNHNGKGNASNIYRLTLDDSDLIKRTPCADKKHSPVPNSATPPVPTDGIAMPNNDNPMPDAATPPVPTVGTRISHSFEPVIEPVIEPDLCDAVKPPATKNKKGGDTPLQKSCRATWAAYCHGYTQRYGTEPLRNQKISAQVKQFVQRVGMECAPELAMFYLTLNNGFYVQKLHPVGNMLADAEALHTQWQTGRTMTTTRAQQIDRTQTNANAADETIQMLRSRRAAERGQNA